MKNNQEIQYRVNRFDSALRFVCEKIREPLKKIPDAIKAESVEIRVRVNRGIGIICPGKTYFLRSDGKITEFLSENLLKADKQDLSDSFKSMCDYSVYSFQDQIKNGFITFKGGNRVGICGSAVLTGESVSHIKNITSLNIRIAKEFKGCAETIFENIKRDSLGTLIVGPPACGKTTVLRDLARIISTCQSNCFIKTVIIDERSEIAAAFEGTPQMDVGLCDVLTGFPKGDGILKAVRCLSPDIIICDEIGSAEDASAIAQSLNAGVRIIASIHAKNQGELLNRPQARKILSSGAFEKIVFLSDSSSPGTVLNICKVSDIYDKNYRDNSIGNVRSFRRLRSV
jgi:stage III sporulation protein AA